MKFLIVDDSLITVKTIVNSLRRRDYDVFGIIPQNAGVYGGNAEWSHETGVTEADVIFLDHNMPGRNGEQWLECGKRVGIDFSQKKIIGISCDPQPYLTEQIRSTDIEDKVLEIATSGGKATT